MWQWDTLWRRWEGQSKEQWRDCEGRRGLLPRKKTSEDTGMLRWSWGLISKWEESYPRLLFPLLKDKGGLRWGRLPKWWDVRWWRGEEGKGHGPLLTPTFQIWAAHWYCSGLSADNWKWEQQHFINGEAKGSGGSPGNNFWRFVNLLPY